MDWLAALTRLRRDRQPGVIVTVAAVRGHAPQDGGAKMVVSADSSWGTVGGGNLEATALTRARALLAGHDREPVLLTLQLSDKAPAEFGVQCCGGEVTLLLEPVRVPPAVAIFGMGHVGWELARILSRHDLDLHLIDSRPSAVTPDRLAALAGGPAAAHVHRVPVPESVLAELSPGTHVLIMTHDHAEDAALCDSALRTPGLASIGLIGSSAKWGNFRRQLVAEGHSQQDVDRITTPIGLPGLTAKDPASLAVGVAAALLMAFEAAR